MWRSFREQHADALAEFDGDAFNEDNVSAVRGVYHLPSGPVFAHGSERSEKMSAEVIDGAFRFNYGETGFENPGAFDYDVADVSSANVRA